MIAFARHNRPRSRQELLETFGDLPFDILDRLPGPLQRACQGVGGIYVVAMKSGAIFRFCQGWVLDEKWMLIHGAEAFNVTAREQKKIKESDQEVVIKIPGIIAARECKV